VIGREDLRSVPTYIGVSSSKEKPLVLYGGWSAKPFGRLVSTTFEMTGDARRDEIVGLEAASDLLWYVNEFLFFGCGLDHVFEGDPKDRLAKLDCTKCGAVKKIGMSWDADAERARMATQGN